MSLVNTINLSFEMTKALTDMEVNGIKINVDTLHKLRDEYQTELVVLNKKLDTIYEYKDYNSPYYFSVYSNPPIVFKENSSTLISRNLHNVDFSNEVGHHILINKSFSDQINVILSSAFSFNPIRNNSKSTVNYKFKNCKEI